MMLMAVDEDDVIQAFVIIMTTLYANGNAAARRVLSEALMESLDRPPLYLAVVAAVAHQQGVEQGYYTHRAEGDVFALTSGKGVSTAIEMMKKMDEARAEAERCDAMHRKVCVVCREAYEEERKNLH